MSGRIHEHATFGPLEIEIEGKLDLETGEIIEGPYCAETGEVLCAYVAETLYRRPLAGIPPGLKVQVETIVLGIESLSEHHCFSDVAKEAAGL